MSDNGNEVIIDEILTQKGIFEVQDSITNSYQSKIILKIKFSV
jgi:hypothetical protein